MTGKIVDKREQALFYHHGPVDMETVLKPLKEPLESPLVPDGVTNVYMNITDGKHNLGDFQVGDDGFLEAMFILPDGRLVKLKRDAGDTKVWLQIHRVGQITAREE